jgi:hypothetical protein
MPNKIKDILEAIIFLIVCSFPIIFAIIMPFYPMGDNPWYVQSIMGFFMGLMFSFTIGIICMLCYEY